MPGAKIIVVWGCLYENLTRDLWYVHVCAHVCVYWGDRK